MKELRFSMKVSIITITYHAKAVLLPTMESVARQSYPNIEHIVIDGASSDGTPELIRERFPHVRLTSEPDRGIYDAMNKGICQATGEFLWFLNAGDSFRTDTSVEDVVNWALAQEKLPDILYGDTMIVDEKREDMHLRRLRPPENLQKRDFLKGMLVCHQAFIVRRTLVLPYDLRYKLSSDYDWCLRMLERSQSTIQVRKILVNYLDGGISQKRHFRSLRERFCIMVKHFGLFPTLFSHLSFLFIRHR